MTLTLLTLLTIFGLSIAALIGGYRKYMFYRRDVFGTTVLRTWYALQCFPIFLLAVKCLSICCCCHAGWDGTSSAQVSFH